MVTQVTFGNFFQLNGKTVLGGAGGSGIDTQSLINTIVQARSAPATQDKDQIKVNDTQSASLTQFQTLLSNFQASADALRNPPGVDNEANNVFKFTSGSVTSNTAVAASNYLSVSTEPGAALESYTVTEITSLATKTIQGTGVFNLPSINDPSAVTASATAGKFKAGTLTFSGGATVTLNANDSLNTVVAKINAVKGSTGIAAAIIQIDSTHFQISFVSTETGTDANFDLTAASTVADTAGVLSNIGLGVKAAQNSGQFAIADADQIVVSAAGLGITSQFAPGTLTVNGQAIVLTEGQTLNQVATAFNAVSANTGITATVVQDGPGDFHLAFAAVRPGASHNFDLTGIPDPDGVLTGLGLGAASAGTTTTLTAGTNAAFKVNGISITRQSNSINDVIDGVTFSLLQQTPDAGTHLTVNVNPDTTTVQNSIVTFVNAYNAIKTFAAQQTQLNADGTFASTAILAGNQTFRSIMADITINVTSQVAGLSTLSSLGELGITLTNQPATSTTPAVGNILTVNDGALSSYLATNFSGVADLFGFNLTADNPDLKVFSSTNAISATAFTLSLNPGTTTFTATVGVSPPITLDYVALPGGGYTLTGPAGSVLDGLKLIYASSSTATIHVTATNGIASKLYNTSDAALTSDTGLLPIALQQLTDSNTQLNKDIEAVNLQVAIFQQQLIRQFAALESAVSNVNHLLASLAANDTARVSASGN